MVVEQGSVKKRSFHIVVDGHRLAAEFIEPAAGPVLIFLHEGLGSIGQWRDFPAQLSEATGLPALVYDRWGYGKSAPFKGKRGISYLHDEALRSLPDLVNRLDIEKAFLIGHSDGGTIALIYAAVHPEKVLGVITEAAHVFVEEIGLKGIHQAVRMYETADLRKRLHRYHGDNTESVFRGWSDTWLSLEFRNWNVEEYLPKITVPVLAIQGADDEYGTPAQVEAIAGQVSGRAESLLIPGCGHIPHHQARERILAEMKRFISSIIG